MDESKVDGIAVAHSAQTVVRRADFGADRIAARQDEIDAPPRSEIDDARHAGRLRTVERMRIDVQFVRPHVLRVAAGGDDVRGAEKMQARTATPDDRRGRAGCRLVRRGRRSSARAHPRSPSLRRRRASRAASSRGRRRAVGAATRADRAARARRARRTVRRARGWRVAPPARARARRVGAGRRRVRADGASRNPAIARDRAVRATRARVLARSVLRTSSGNAMFSATVKCGKSA